MAAASGGPPGTRWDVSGVSAVVQRGHVMPPGVGRNGEGWKADLSLWWRAKKWRLDLRGEGRSPTHDPGDRFGPERAEQRGCEGFVFLVALF